MPSDIFDKECFFSYCLQDAWGRLDFTIEVFDRKQENVVATYWGCSPFSSGKIASEKHSLDISEISQIKQIINKSPQLFEIDYLEFPFVLDGVINDLYFCDGHKRKEFHAFNLWAFRSSTPSTKDNKRKNADFVIGVFDEIRRFLVEKGVNPVFFSLNNDE